jgi:hypothetical protein
MSVRGLSERVEELQNLLVSIATSGSGSGSGEYDELRRELTELPQIKDRLPRFVRTCRSRDQFWQFIKQKFGTYAERRKFLWDEFRPLLDSLEGATPITTADAELLSRLSLDAVNAVWQRALDRVVSEPEGAITAARALLETVCKHILDDLPVTYSDTDDLPKLYRLTADALNIAPSQHTEHVFKQILGGATAVVEGLGAVRNRLGDAHGKGRQPAKPAPRHARLAVNLAGSMTLFLVETWEARKAHKE